MNNDRRIKLIFPEENRNYALFFNKPSLNTGWSTTSFFIMQHQITPKYCDANSILLINPAGMLRKLHCPFRVRCRDASGAFMLGMWVWVEEVGTSSTDELIYWILDKPYSHHHFEITISF